MKTVTKYFVLWAICANACTLRAMDHQGQWTIVDETAKFSNTTDKPASSEKRELESREASSSSFSDFQQPPRKKRETEDDMTKLLRVALARAKEEFDHSHTHTIACTPTSSSSAGAASELDTIPPVTESCSSSAAFVSTERANRKGPEIKSLSCPFRRCPFRLDASMANSKILYRHIRLAHSDKYKDDAWHCDDCEEFFTYPNGLVTHVCKKHLPCCQFKCSYCSKEFSKRSLCDDHMRRKHGPKQYHCIFCDQESDQTSHWKRHLESHFLGHKPKLRNTGEGLIFACPCSIGCRNGDELAAHSCKWKKTGVFLCPCKKMIKQNGWPAHQKTCPQAQWPSKS